MKRSDVVSARVIPWESGTWGVSVIYANGDKRAYYVGSKVEAEQECLSKKRVEIVEAH